jgi:LysR family nitrogen assimilation transcriptional regulator
MQSETHMESTLSRISNITMRQLVAYRELAQVGAFGAAAVRLGVGQPWLSRTLKQLEEELGVTLVRRHSKGAVLTSKGKKLRDLVVAFIEALENMPDAETKMTQQGKVVIGIPLTLSSLIAPALLKSVWERKTELDISILEDSSLGLEHATEAGLVDVALLYDPASTPTLTSKLLIEEDMVVIAAPSWEWLGEQSSLSVRDLKSLPMVLLKPDQNDRRRLAEAERQQGIRLEPVAEVSSPSTIKALVNQGIGFSIASALGVSREVAGGSLQSRLLGTPTLSTRLWVSTRTDDASSDIIKNLVETLSDCITRCAENRPSIRLTRRFGVVLG